LPDGPGSPPGPSPLSVLYFGIYSKGPEYPRNRNIILALRRAGVRVDEAHASLAGSFSQRLAVARSPLRAAGFLFRLLGSYFSLTLAFLKAGRHQVVLVGHPGHFHVHLARILRALFSPGSLLVLDVYIPLYNALVEDRGLFRPSSLPARFLHRFEGSCCRAADLCLLDTHEHGRYLAGEYALPPGRVSRVLVGPTVEGKFDPPPPLPPGPAFTVLYFGTYIPLHGVEIILQAARECGDDPGIRFILLGDGQLRRATEESARALGLANVEFQPWCPPDELPGRIRAAHLSLGVFGTTDKASRVIPSKVFDICAVGAPFVTADTPAIREAFRHGENAFLIPPGDAPALAAAVRLLKGDPDLRRRLGAMALSTARDAFSPGAIGSEMAGELKARLGGSLPPAPPAP